MAVTKEEVRHVAALSKLTLNEDELTGMQSAMGEILDYMKVLANAPLQESGAVLGGVVPNAFGREDTVSPSHERAALLAPAPMQDGTYITVPKTVE